MVVKYEKNMFLATHRRATFYILLSRGSAIEILLDVNLHTYASDEKLNPANANFPNRANRSSQKKLQLDKKVQRGHPVSAVQLNET